MTRARSASLHFSPYQRVSDQRRLGPLVWEWFDLRVSAVMGTTENGVHAEASVSLSPGHNSLAYGLVRTAPLTGRSLEYVPGGVAVVALLGLDPAGETAPGSGPGAPSLSAMDLGREVFGNIEELALFVLPPGREGGAARPPIPEIGLVVVVKDPAKSEALWTWQSLSLI